MAAIKCCLADVIDGDFASVKLIKVALKSKIKAEESFINTFTALLFLKLASEMCAIVEKQKSY